MALSLKLGALQDRRMEVPCSFLKSRVPCVLALISRGGLSTKLAELIPEPPHCGAAFPEGRGQRSPIHSLEKCPQIRDTGPPLSVPLDQSSLISPLTWQNTREPSCLSSGVFSPHQPPLVPNRIMHISLSQVFVTKLPIPPYLGDRKRNVNM